MAYVLSSKENLKVGKESYYNGKIYIKGRGLIDIGSYCTFGENLRIIGGNNHNYNYPAMQVTFYRKHFGRYAGHIPEAGVKIGSDVWSGDNVTVLDGSIIGDGCVLASGAVVKGVFPPYTIIGGIPGRILKYRFSSEVRELMENIKWWDWDDEKISRNYKFFHSDFSTLSVQQIKDILVS